MKFQDFNYRFVITVICGLIVTSSFISLLTLLINPFSGWDLNFQADDDVFVLARKVTLHSLMILTAFFTAVSVTIKPTNAAKRRFVMIPLSLCLVFWLLSCSCDIVVIIIATRDSKQTTEKWIEIVLVFLNIVSCVVKFVYGVVLVYYMDFQCLICDPPSSLWG